MTDDERRRYPLGRFDPTAELTDEARDEALAVLDTAPGRLREAVRGLDDEQMDTPYRDGGWTVRQVVHHLPDSHLNGYVRTRWALTEERPRIRTYDQAAWAELPDARTAPVGASLALLEAVHARWVRLLRDLGPAELSRSFVHPEGGPEGTVDTLIALYAWHSQHHTAHILGLRERMGW